MVLFWPHLSSKGMEYGFKKTGSFGVSSALLDHPPGTQEPKFHVHLTLTCPAFCQDLFPVLTLLRTDLANNMHITRLEGCLGESYEQGQGWSLDAWMPCQHMSEGIPPYQGMGAIVDREGKQDTGQGHQGWKMAFYISQIYEESKHFKFKTWPFTSL